MEPKFYYIFIDIKIVTVILYKLSAPVLTQPKIYLIFYKTHFFKSIYIPCEQNYIQQPTTLITIMRFLFMKETILFISL